MLAIATSISDIYIVCRKIIPLLRAYLSLASLRDYYAMKAAAFALSTVLRSFHSGLLFPKGRKESSSNPHKNDSEPLEQIELCINYIRGGGSLTPLPRIPRWRHELGAWSEVGDSIKLVRRTLDGESCGVEANLDPLLLGPRRS